MRIRELLIVEGKYDAAKLSGIVDGLILTTGGFSIYHDQQKKDLIRDLGKKRGIIILTDSDAAGFQLRNYIQNFARGAVIKHAYIPAVQGKEKRKKNPSKEGTLGVEGLPAEVLRQALLRAGATEQGERSGRQLSYTDLYELGISGTQNSAARRRELLQSIGLPLRLSKKALLETLNATYTYEELTAVCAPKPVLFWDFHGTLTLPDSNWVEAFLKLLPAGVCNEELLHQKLRHAGLPWWTMPGQKTPVGKAWWAEVKQNFAPLLAECGYDEADIKAALTALRGRICDPAAHRLYADAIPTLALLQTKGYRSFIVSNNFPELWQVAEGLGLAPYFSGCVVSGATGWDKPSAEIFHLALQLAGSPQQAVMLGDNPTDDIAGAKKAGLFAIAVHAGNAVPGADACCDTLAEVPAVLAGAPWLQNGGEAQ